MANYDYKIGYPITVFFILGHYLKLAYFQIQSWNISEITTWQKDNILSKPSSLEATFTVVSRQCLCQKSDQHIWLPCPMSIRLICYTVYFLNSEVMNVENEKFRLLTKQIVFWEYMSNHRQWREIGHASILNVWSAWIGVKSDLNAVNGIVSHFSSAANNIWSGLVEQDLGPRWLYQT